MPTACKNGGHIYSVRRPPKFSKFEGASLFKFTPPGCPNFLSRSRRRPSSIDGIRVEVSSPTSSCCYAWGGCGCALGPMRELARARRRQGARRPRLAGSDQPVWPGAGDQGGAHGGRGSRGGAGTASGPGAGAAHPRWRRRRPCGRSETGEGEGEGQVGHMHRWAGPPAASFLFFLFFIFLI